MRHSPLRLTAAATAVIATLGLSAGTAFAAATTPAGPSSTKTKTSHTVKLPTNPTLQQIQAAAATDISNRVTTLNTAVAKVSKLTDLGSDQATLLHTLQTDIPGLQALGQQIAALPAGTSVQTAQADYMQIFTNFRIYVLVVPVTRAVAIDDRITNTAGPKLTKVAARIAAKNTAGNAQVQSLLADLAHQVTSATSAVKGLPATVEGYTVADWNANHGLLKSAGTTTKGAVADLVKARSDAKQAVADLGLGKGHAKNGATATTTPTTAS